MIDRASIVTAAILCIVRTRGAGAEARAEIRAILESEFADIKQQTVSEIRPEDG
jgi:hypothetical protein